MNHAILIVAVSCSLTGTGGGVFAAPPCLQQRVVASDPATFDNFGHSVAAASATYVFAGSYHDDDLGSNSGSAYVFRKQGTSWTQVQKLLASDGAANDAFGFRMAADGDRVVVGSVGHWHPGHARTGAAYIFRFDGEQWVQEAELLPSDGQQDDGFGREVAIHGQVALIGADLADPGAAYVFRYNPATGQWTQEQKLVSPTVQKAHGFFGRSVSVRGDRALIGTSEDSISPNAGAAYMYRHDPAAGQWVLEQTLLPDPVPPWPMPGSSYGFGLDVCLTDGGAIVSATSQAIRGAVHFFRHDGMQWVRAHKQLFPESWNSAFGSRVTIDGDWALVGLKGIQPSLPGFNGAAYIYRRDPATDKWNQQGPALFPPPGGGPFFGHYALDLSGTTAVIGAYGEASQRGAAYIYTINPPTGDLNCDARVNGLDIALLLGQWTGSTLLTTCPPTPTADLNGDCMINGLDLALLLGAWTSSESGAR